MKNPVALLLVLLSLAGAALPAWSEKADRNKPMNISADALRYDDVKQVSVFTGRVELTKGTIVIRGAQLEVRQDPEGYQFGLVTGSADASAFFRQKREGVDEYIEGEGQTIEYDGRADTVKFVQRALLRRYRGAVLADEISGALIVYDNFNDLFSVDGSVGKPGTAAPGGRVRAVLTPKPDAPAPSASATGAAPKLQASPTLGGGAK
ncbi:MAG: lipopolysaccharide transport periplasmic protein LptA [Burkholderiales bacterium]|nr:lipopolysaccharide transport periplasmic protein LptA [Burkholderiales bacterium]